jgi:pimeloyl-ACP methyl ester carboxylesterase
MAEHPMQRFIYLFCFGLTLLTAIPKPIYAGAVNQTIPGLNLTAEADYTQGDSALPAVLILHGFLTTHHFHTVQTIKQAFEQAGYSTLAPTLTLNVDRRREFLQCNALHTHTLENDLLEIDFWIQWLKQQGHEKVVLVGHSSGSQTLLHFLAQKNHPDIALGLFTSLFFMNGPEMGTREAELQSAQKALQTADNSAKQLFCHPGKFSFLPKTGSNDRSVAPNKPGAATLHTDGRRRQTLSERGQRVACAAESHRNPVTGDPQGQSLFCQRLRSGIARGGYSHCRQPFQKAITLDTDRLNRYK